MTCSVGIWTVGWVSIPFGVVNGAVSVGGGYLAKHTGRLPIFVAGESPRSARVSVFLCLWIR